MTVGRRAAIGTAVAACFLAWAYGPDLPATEAEAKEAYSGKGVVVCGAS